MTTASVIPAEAGQEGDTIMKRLLTIAPLAALALSGCGETGEPAHFQVLGQAGIEKDAEIFRITFTLDERSKNRAESLAAASKRLDDIRDKLGRLEGLERLTIETGKAETETVRPDGCDRNAYDNKEYPDNCAPIDHITGITAHVKGAPASAAGSALSLLSELEVDSVSVASYDVMDREAAELEARRRALEDATATAEALAKQAGSKVGRPLEIKYGDARYGQQFELGELPEQTVVDGDVPQVRALERPDQPLDLPPAKVAFNARVAVKFALEKPKAEK